MGASMRVGMCADIKVSGWLGLWSTVDVGLAGLEHEDGGWVIYVRACVRACVCVCVCVRECVRACGRACVNAGVLSCVCGYVYL